LQIVHPAAILFHEQSLLWGGRALRILALIQVYAAGLNPIDNIIPTGAFKPIIKLQLPATMGSDLAGVVVEVGSRVTRLMQRSVSFSKHRISAR
jgi:hypothetical protein